MSSKSMDFREQEDLPEDEVTFLQEQLWRMLRINLRFMEEMKSLRANQKTQASIIEDLKRNNEQLWEEK